MRLRAIARFTGRPAGADGICSGPELNCPVALFIDSVDTRRLEFTGSAERPMASECCDGDSESCILKDLVAGRRDIGRPETISP